MRFGVAASVLLHASAIGLAFVSLPENWRPQLASEPYVPIEILSEAELALRTSVPAARPEPDPVEEPPEPEPEPPAEEEVEPEPQMAPEPEPAPPEPEPEPEPAPPAPEPEPEPEPAPKPEPPKPQPPRERDLDFDRLSALIDKEKQETRPTGAPAEAPREAERAQAQVGAGDRLTASDISKMRAAVGRCWQTSSLIGAPEPEKLLVRLEVRLNRDGTLAGQPRTMNATQINLSGNRFWKSAEQIAIRAVISCQPYDFLSQDRYETWREMELNFDPSQMAGF